MKHLRSLCEKVENGSCGDFYCGITMLEGVLGGVGAEISLVVI